MPVSMHLRELNTGKGDGILGTSSSSADTYECGIIAENGHLSAKALLS